MFASMPKVLGQSGIDFTVQTLETTDTHILIRVRSTEMIPRKTSRKCSLSGNRRRRAYALRQSRRLSADGPE